MIPKSCNNCLIQSNSLAVAAKVKYCASADEREVIDYFLDFHDTKQSPRKTQNPKINFLESGQKAQSTFEKDVNFKVNLEEKKSPCPRLNLR